MGRFEDDDLIPIKPTAEIAVCTLDTTIQVAAILMSKRNVGSIIVVDGEKRPRGIITDTDLRRKVIAGKIPHSDIVSSIMSSPVLTVHPVITAANAILKMMRHNVRHLCVTEDGTPSTTVVGVISEHDVLLLHGNNPAILVKEILQSDNINQLVAIRERAEQIVIQYAQQQVSIPFIADIITEINDSLVARLILLAESELRARGFQSRVPYCWVALGSEGRKEQLLRSDQDNAIIFADLAENESARAREYFSLLATMVTENLVRCGFVLCPGNNIASNPRWCQPLSTWIEYFSGWIHTPSADALLKVATFFDLRPIAGEFSLAQQLREHISSDLQYDNKCLILLANDAVKNPRPLGMFGRLATEPDKQGLRQFDLKLRATKTLTETARILALERGFIETTSTIERFRRVMEARDFDDEVMPELLHSFETLMRIRLTQGKPGKDAGRFITPSDLYRDEQRRLRDALKAVTKAQTMLRVRFQLDALGLR